VIGLRPGILAEDGEVAKRWPTWLAFAGLFLGLILLLVYAHHNWIEISTSEDQTMAKLKHHVTALVKVPVFDHWTPYLWQAGQAAMLVSRTRSGGNVNLWTVDLEVDSWTRLITGGLAQGVIHLPMPTQRAT